MRLGRVALIICETRLLATLPRIKWAISIRGNMFQYPPPDEDYIIFNGQRFTTKWQECKSCHGPVFAIVSDFPLCDKCREIDEGNRDGGIIHGYKTKKKEKIPDSIKWAVWERDNFTCQHCGSRKNLSVDHIIPESKGGKLTMENTQTLCCKCNSRKGAR
jgi:Zn finger protein HypA/HybF involved in hydrogenase expression